MSVVDTGRRYRTFWPRVKAGFVDGLVLLPFGYLTDPHFYSYKSAGLTLALDATNYSISILYSVLLHARFGQTLGKMAVGVKVLDLSESRLPTLRQAILRDIGEIVFSVIMFTYVARIVAAGGYTFGDEYVAPFWGALAWAGAAWSVLEILTMLTNDKRRAVHDFIAGTVVIRDA